MSEYKRVTGTLTPVDIKEELNHILRNYDPDEIHKLALDTDEDIRHFLYEEYEEKYALINGKWYKSKIKHEDANDFFCDLKVNKKGEIKFHTYFHDGGTYWEEMVEDKLRIVCP
jgi:hypothetical protein